MYLAYIRLTKGVYQRFYTGLGFKAACKHTVYSYIGFFKA